MIYCILNVYHVFLVFKCIICEMYLKGFYHNYLWSVIVCTCRIPSILWLWTSCDIYHVTYILTSYYVILLSSWYIIISHAIWLTTDYEYSLMVVYYVMLYDIQPTMNMSSHFIMEYVSHVLLCKGCVIHYYDRGMCDSMK